MKIKLEMSRERALLLSKACEIIARIGMCQFKDMVELLIQDYNYDFANEIEKYLKQKLRPELSYNSYHSMSNDVVPEECKVAWECYQNLRREIAWFDKGMDWRKDQRNWNNMVSVNFDEPMKVSKLEDKFKTERIEDNTEA